MFTGHLLEGAEDVNMQRGADWPPPAGRLTGDDKRLLRTLRHAGLVCVCGLCVDSD